MCYLFDGPDHDGAGRGRLMPMQQTIECLLKIAKKITTDIHATQILKFVTDTYEIIFTMCIYHTNDDSKVN